MDNRKGTLNLPGSRELRHTCDSQRSAVWQEICRQLQKYISSNFSVLDLGSGYGDFLRHIKAFKKYGLERQGSLLSFWPKGVNAFVQSALDPWPLDDGMLDVIFASNSFEHFPIEDSESILGEAWRVLQPGGTLMVIQPNIRLQPGRYFDDFTHKTPFTEVSFGDFLASQGWWIRHCEGRFLPFTMTTHCPKWRWLVRLYLALPFRPFAGQFFLIAEKPRHAG